MPLLAEMETYANVMPAVNQLELHPRYASPALREYARENGIHLTAYGTANSVLFEQDTNATVKQGPDSVEIIWRDFWLEKPLEFWLEIPNTEKRFKNGGS